MIPVETAFVADLDHKDQKGREAHCQSDEVQHHRDWILSQYRKKTFHPLQLILDIADYLTVKQVDSPLGNGSIFL